MTVKVAARHRVREVPDAATIEQRLRDVHLYDHASGIAQRWHITLPDMLQSPVRPAPNARAEFYRELRLLKWSYQRIGELVGRNLSTVRFACLDAAGPPSEAR